MTFIIDPYRFGGGGGGGAVSPATTLGADLVAWYPRGAASKFDAVVGGSAVTTHLQEIGRWEDASGNAYHATRGGLISQGHIQWRTDDNYNGVGIVWFNGGTGAWFDIPNGVGTALDGAGQGEIFLAWKSKGSPSGSWQFSNSGAENLYPWNDGHIYEGWGSNTRRDLGVPSPDIATDYRVYDIGAASNDYDVWLAGGNLLHTTTNTVTFKTSGITFGNGGSQLLFSYVSEIIISKRKTNTTDRAAIYTWLTTP